MTKHERFLLICYGWYYPNGGINDVIGSVEKYEDAIKWFDEKVCLSAGKNCPSVSYQVFDCVERKIVAEWSSDH